MVEGFGIPPSWHTCGKECLHFRGDKERLIMPCIEQRFNSETIARGKQSTAFFIPQHKGELASQPVQALHAQVLIKMQRNLAIRVCAQSVTGGLELALDRLVIIELAVDHD